MLTFRSLSLLMLVGILIASCGGDDDDDLPDAGEWSRDNMETLIRGQWGRAYDQLHPEHQEIIDRDLYIECNDDRSFPDMDIEIDEVFEESINVPAMGETETTAVTMRLSVDDDAEFITRHLIEHDGDWTWIQTQDAIDAYSNDECP